MKKYIIKNKAFLKIVTAFVLIGFLGTVYNVNASTNVPELNISASVSKPSIYINEEVNVTYTVQPEPIDGSVINKRINKEIILVVDTSGSMTKKLDHSQTRIAALKIAAKNFINNFKEEETTKIGIVDYDFNGKKTSELTNAIEQDKLKNVIDGLRADGATNIGDGIRVASGMFSNDTSVKKYLVLMSDGMPTSFTYSGYAGGYNYDYYQYDNQGTNHKFYYLPNDLMKNNNWRYFTSTTDDTNLKYGTFGDIDPMKYCQEYSVLMAKTLKSASITNYVIGFSGGSDSSKLTEISNAGGGSYYDAKDANAINKVYAEIADKIKADYTVEDVKLNFTLPEGLEYINESFDTQKNENKYTKSIPNIEYKLTSDKKKYISQPFDIKLKLKGLIKGNYKLQGADWNLSYKDLNGVVIKKPLTEVVINVEKYNTEFEMSRKLIPERNEGNFNINHEFDMEYSITPKPITINTSEKPKEIMLVVDTSKSMEWSISKNNDTSKPTRIELAKTSLNNFINKFENSSNVKIGLVTYNSSATVYEQGDISLFEHNNTQGIKNSINDINPDGGTNIGDGLRKAASVLSVNKDAKKFIILMTDGEPTSYTTYSQKNSNYYTELDTENMYSFKDGNDYTKGLEYSNIMAKVIKENKDLDITTFAIGFSTGANVKTLTEIANNIGGTYLNATNNDVNAIDKVYSQLAEQIKTDLSLQNVQFEQQLPDGLVLADSPGNSVTKDLNINYTYNSTKKQYEAKPITFSVKVRGTKVGVYNLSNDATFNYVDLDGTQTRKFFDPIKVSILDSYVIKQGLFQPGGGNSRETYVGEENMKYMNNSALTVTPNMEYQLAAFLRTNGQQTELNIKLNSNVNNNVSSMTVASVTIYSVGEDGTIKPTEIKGEVLNDNGKNPIIKVNLIEESTNGYKYYIINYNYKINEISNLTDSNSITILNKVEVVNTDKNNDFTTEIVSMPDVF